MEGPPVARVALLPILALLVLFSSRSFTLMHDCGHNSLFATRWLNRSFGFLLGCLNAIPQYPWSRGHAFHHQHNGNWEKYRGPSALLTCQQFLALSPLRQWFYQFLRHPLMLLPGGLFYLVLKPRLQLFLGIIEWMFATISYCMAGGSPSAVDLPAFWRQLRSNYWYTGGEFLDLLFNNIIVISSWILMGRWLGHGVFWSCYAIVMSFSAAIFICIFFVQHNFQGSYASGSTNWNYLQGALKGSSNLVMPAILNWFSADISLHSIHHLCERIPNYRLRACHNHNANILSGCKSMLISDIPSCFRYILWDDINFQLSTIAEARAATFAHSA